MDTSTQPLKLAVVVPWTSEFIWKRCALSLLKLKHPDACEVEFFFSEGDGWCSARRHNSCLEQGKMWGADLICILGADQTYPPDMLRKLVGHYRTDHEVVAANVPIRGHVANQGTKPFQPICWRYKADENGNTVHSNNHKDIEFVGPAQGDLVEIHGCGSGVLMFPTEVLNHIPPPWFYEEPVGPTFERKACADWPFVGRLRRNAKCKVWCDTTIQVKHIHPFEIDETFSERFKDWEVTGDPSCCEVPDPDGDKIGQVRVSPSIPFYDEKFRKRYELASYYNPNSPAFFFGCYTKDDLDAIQKHQSLAVVIWAGTDAMNMRKALEPTGKHPFADNVRHVAISKFIEDDLKALGLPFVSLPLCNVDEDIFTFQIGRGHCYTKVNPGVAVTNAVYAYVPKWDREKYGGPIIDELIKRLPEYTFIVNDDNNKTPDEMRRMYEACFVGVRPLAHDGLSNTVIEMGLMGRRVVWNGNSPNAIPWQTIDDIVDAIRSQKSGPLDSQIVAQKTKDWINVGSEWKTTEFYEKQTMRTMPEGPVMEPYDYEKYFQFRYNQGPLGAGGPQPAGDEVKWTRETIMHLLDEYKCADVTEVGCGSMVRWKFLPHRHYVGVDVCDKALDYAREKFPGTLFLQVDATKEDIPEADAIICIDMMQHIKPEDFDTVFNRLLKAARKVLIVKTSVNIGNLYYQFNHDWTDAAPSETLDVPGSDVSRVFVFEKVASGGADGANAAAVAVPPLHSLSSEEVHAT